jgi:lipid-A-disaccharide synthase
VPELLQGEASPARMAAEAETLLSDPAVRAEQVRGLADVRRTLGTPGAPLRVAEEIAAFLPPPSPT